MTDRIITTKIKVCSHSELNLDDKKLVEAAMQATRNSYAPYSQFHVGAAIMLGNGVMVKGANQENAAFAGICAERSAAYNAGANYPGVPIEAIAIAAFQNGDYVEEPVSPCGVCRQALLEFEKNAGKPIRVVLVGKDKVYVIEGGVKALLPLSFVDF